MYEPDEEKDHSQYHEHTFRSLLEHSDDGIAILSFTGKLLYISPSVEKILGYTDAEVMSMDMFALTHPDDIMPLAATMKQVIAHLGKPLKGHTGRMLHKNGSWRWIEATVTNLLQDPAIRGIVDNFRDITDKKASAETIQHVNRLYAFISQINQSIVRSNSERELYKNICRVAIDFGKFKAAWIGMLDIPERKITLVEQSGMITEDLPYFTNVPYSTDGPQDQVVRNATCYVCNNVQDNLLIKDWKPFALKRGYGSCITLPVKRAGEIVATFNLYAEETDFFNSKEIALLQEATGDISYALGVFDKEKQRAEAEEKLKNSEVRLKEAQAIAKIGSWETDLKTMNVKWSEETYHIFDTNPANFKATHAAFLNYIHPLDRVKVDTAFSNSLHNHAVNRIEHRIITANGTEKFVEEHWQVYFDEEGNAVNAQGTCQDNTERTLLQLQLQKSEKFSQQVLSSLSLHIAVIDQSGKLVMVNEAWNDFAINNDALLRQVSKGSNYFDACEMAIANGDDLAKEALTGIKDVFAHKVGVFELEYPCHSPTERRWFVLHAVGFGDDETKVVCAHIDITERKKAEKALHKSESNLQAIIENTDASIYSLDRNLCYITYNQTLQKNLVDLYSLEIKPGDNVYSFLDKIDPAESVFWQATYAKALAGESVKFEKEYKIGDFYSCISFSIYPIRENNLVTGLSCFALDVTKQKLDNVQKEKMTADIIHRNKNLEQFSYIVSHNLRAPIANILGLTDLLMTNECNAEEKEMIEGISSSITKLDGVIKDLNHTLQVNNPVNENKTTVILSHLLSDIKLSINNLLQAEDVSIIANFSEVDELLTLKSYLYSIFFNLISNSIKYRQPGIKPVIYITSHKTEKNIELVFEDNGLGIDLVHNADNIFGLYKRFHSHTEGKGMGLYMVKAQVEALEGTISIESEVNKGTIFKMVFKSV
jgi:PAS domain S-box-containing protein